MMYFPTKWGAKEPQNPQNHRVDRDCFMSQDPGFFMECHKDAHMAVIFTCHTKVACEPYNLATTAGHNASTGCGGLILQGGHGFLETWITYLDVFLLVVFYGFYRGINHHQKPPFGRLLSFCKHFKQIQVYLPCYYQ